MFYFIFTIHAHISLRTYAEAAAFVSRFLKQHRDDWHRYIFHAFMCGCLACSLIFPVFALARHGSFYFVWRNKLADAMKGNTNKHLFTNQF
jgi:hypothetical protein